MTAAALMLADPGIAQETAPTRQKDPTQAWAEQAARIALAEAQSYDIRLRSADGPRLKLAETPALKWSNNDDATIHGGVFVWMHEGRPEAIASIFKFFTVKDEFSVELHSLSESPLVAAKNKRTIWEPTEAGVTFAPLTTAAAPAKTAAARLMQMRGIARDFSGNMTTFDQTTHQLRLLTQPLVRYAGEGKRPPLDGAIFAFARATDPDVLLVLEARAGDGAEVRWHYALARMHCGAAAMSYHERDVWSVEQMTHPFARSQGAYTLLQNLAEPAVASPPNLNPEP